VYLTVKTAAVYCFIGTPAIGLKYCKIPLDFSPFFSSRRIFFFGDFWVSAKELRFLFLEGVLSGFIEVAVFSFSSCRN